MKMNYKKQGDFMGFLDFLGKKQVELTEGQKKWNMMWESWAEGEAVSPYAELMTYQSEINNGGHLQYFENVKNTGDLRKELSVLENILPLKLKANLQEVYKAYLNSDTNIGEIAEHCDNVFYENEEEINFILQSYSAEFKL